VPPFVEANLLVGRAKHGVCHLRRTAKNPW
jgi:hypothetical protein